MDTTKVEHFAELHTADEFSLAKTKLMKDIVGEIVMAESPESVIKKWRNIFKISQKELANALGITSSVVSDYESGRRKSPGIKVIRKYMSTLLDLDEKSGGKTIRSFVRNYQSPALSNSIVDIKEFSSGIDIGRFCELINAPLITKKQHPEGMIYGYTIIDSVRAITELSFNELIKLYGITTQRVLIFTKVSTGKTPLVAIKLTNLHPSLVVLHGLASVDDIAMRIAEVENIPLAVCRLADAKEIVDRLKNIS
ncbi:MAG: helix-turn-helix domain-containing protein [Candidatus Aenigmarchaeota archaeon]|nr:helix-turn-helix domain-containing protein [Candidatus Aenigmarchaeota archaeon]